MAHIDLRQKDPLSRKIGPQAKVCGPKLRTKGQIPAFTRADTTFFLRQSTPNHGHKPASRVPDIQQEKLRILSSPLFYFVGIVAERKNVVKAFSYFSKCQSTVSSAPLSPRAVTVFSPACSGTF